MYKIKNIIYGFFTMSIFFAIFYFALVDSLDIDFSLSISTLNNLTKTDLSYTGLNSLVAILSFFLIGTLAILPLSLYKIKTDKNINFITVIVYMALILFVGYVIGYFMIALGIVSAFLFSLLMVFIYYKISLFFKDRKHAFKARFNTM